MVKANRIRIFACAAVVSALLWVLSGGVGGAEAESATAMPLPVASVHLEQNATDGDAEVVFEVTSSGGQDGLAELSIVSPDGRTVVAFKAPESSTLGIRSFRFESPEPPNIAAVKAAYPEGIYAFSGKTFSGAMLVGKATLSHRLPATATFGKPAPAARNVVSWTAVAGVTAYIVEVEGTENTKITAHLPGSSTSFVVPDGFLSRGTEYKVAIGTMTQEGNISFVETTFTTEK